MEYTNSLYRQYSAETSGSSNRQEPCVLNLERSISERYTEAYSLTNAEETTLMLRNLPVMYTRAMMLSELEMRGVLNDINFLYLPIDFRYQCNVAYCFINVTSAAGVARVYAAMEGTLLKQVPTKKRTIISVGNLQGLRANVEACRNHAAMNLPEQYQPMILHNGVSVPFPPRTTSVVRNGRKGVSSRQVQSNVYRSTLDNRLLGDEVIHSV